MKESDLLPFYNRFSKIEALLEAVQFSLQDSKRELTRHLERVDRLELRQLEIERRMVTGEQFNDLLGKVNALAANETERIAIARELQDLKDALKALERDEAIRKGSDKEKKNSVSSLQFRIAQSIAILATLIAFGQAVLPSLINQPAQFTPPQIQGKP
jgi:chromosome segregation ATPase